MNKAEANMALLMMKGLLTECDEEDRSKIEAAAQGIKDVVSQYGDKGKAALSLVLIEMQAKGELE